MVMWAVGLVSGIEVYRESAEQLAVRLSIQLGNHDRRGVKTLQWDGTALNERIFTDPTDPLVYWVVH